MANIVNDYTVYILAGTVILLTFALLLTNFQHFTCCKCCAAKNKVKITERNTSDIVRDYYYEENPAMASNYPSQQCTTTSTINTDQIEPAVLYTKINKSLKHSLRLERNAKNLIIDDDESNGLYINADCKKTRQTT